MHHLSGRRWFHRSFVILPMAAAVAVLLAGAAWKYRTSLERLAQYVRPIDDRERIAVKTDGFDVLFLVLDACRPDKLSAYGFERQTTPTIDALARDPDATLFRRHYANANWTKASTASLFTGMFVHEHGVFKGWRPTQSEPTGRAFATQVLSDEIETLAEMLAKEGYYTFSIVHGHHLNPQFGFAQGFHEYYTGADFLGDRSRMWATNALLESIKGNYFGYVHLIGCHQPFPPGVRHEGYMDTYGFDYAEAERISIGIDFTTTEIKELINRRELRLNSDDVRFLNLIYEARMRWMDQNIVRPIISKLKETGRYDDTLIIITADHGEALYEHESYAHAGRYLWDEVVQVPMIVKFPKNQQPAAVGAEVSELTSSVDLMPALADLLGRPAPNEVRGAAVFRGRFAESTLVEAYDCPEALNDCLYSWAFLHGDQKLIEYPGESLLFNLQQDPSEQHSLHETQPGAAAELRDRAAELRSVSTTKFLADEVQAEIDEEAVRTLRSLGYIQ
jgi:arylsulfatase A-like enzyme